MSVMYTYLPVQKPGIEHPEGKSCPAHPDILQQSKVHNLMTTSLLLKQDWRLFLVWFYTADVIRFLTATIFHALANQQISAVIDKQFETSENYKFYVLSFLCKSKPWYSVNIFIKSSCILSYSKSTIFLCQLVFYLWSKVLNERDDGIFKVSSGCQRSLCNFRHTLSSFWPHVSYLLVAAENHTNLFFANFKTVQW